MIAAFCAAQTPGEVPFRQEGIASWYGTEFDGRPTASGEIFDSSQFTAAHPSLPFGTILKVTNTQNNRQVQVRVNDRGPFVSARIIDVSRAAAQALDMLATGTAPVVVEAAQGSPVPAAGQALPANPQGELTSAPLRAQETAPVSVPEQTWLQDPPGSPASQTAASGAYSVAILGGVPPAGNGKFYRLQVGAYRIPRNAVEAFDKLKAAGLNPAYERNQDLYRVVLAGLRSEEIPSIAEKLGAAGFREALIREE
ncbi:MAG: septal ring lytic transglycosylase RlpA family protein [Treponema sp.]|jgi:rare lipoprotein A|nr:septal ring lytic transglycosylase RlpA family protein [Treponema sp.]